MAGQPYPVNDSRKEIVFVRHAESRANRDGVWMGRSDGRLSDAGEESLEGLGRRLSAWDFDAVISSPLRRARQTAESFASDIEIDDSFIEIDLGKWEGMLFSDVQEQHGEELQEAIGTRTLPMGGTGESIDQLAERATGAVDRLFQRMGDNERVAVVTHGGFMQPLLKGHLAGDGRRAHGFTSNTGITRIVQQMGRLRLATFNDTGHLGPRSSAVEAHLADGDPILALIRHGRTKANVEGLWQGREDWDLDDVGVAQAEALSEWYGRHEPVYASPLKRATSTARHVALNGVVAVDDLMEIHMGEWEGLTSVQISEQWPEAMDKIYYQGIDLPRGSTGETWQQLTERFATAVSSLDLSQGLNLVVAHGGAIRSYISSLTMTDDTHSESLLTPANTSVSHVAITERGPEILDYSVSTHLEPRQ